MEHLILTETEFFRMIGTSENDLGLNDAYNEFTKLVVSLCTGTVASCHPLPALSYAETELQYHKAINDTNGGISVYVCKALSFVRKMQQHLAASHIQVPPLSNPSHTPKEPTSAATPALQWTGNAIDLVEIIYGINEMGCINNGEITLKELAPILYSFFGVESKDCYRFYIDIKRRKNESRTYFLDRMQAKLNEKMRRDDELERMRR